MCVFVAGERGEWLSRDELSLSCLSDPVLWKIPVHKRWRNSLALPREKGPVAKKKIKKKNMCDE